MLGQLIRRQAPVVVDGETRQGYPFSEFFSRFRFDGNTYSSPFAGVDKLNVLEASRNSMVGACISVRGLVFSEARFRFQSWDSGKPGSMFGTPALRLLEVPWPGATTGDLLAQMELDASVWGNSYWVKSAGQLVRLDPESTAIVMADVVDPVSGLTFGRQLLGYLTARHQVVSNWSEDTPVDPSDGVFFTPDEVAHYRPLADPLHRYRGRSWLSTILPDSLADNELTNYKHAFIRNAATPNLAVVFPKEWDVEDIERFKAAMDSKHAGVDKAFKTLYIGGGADVKTLGADFGQLAMKATQGHGETRIAVAAGVPAAILGISEGLAGSALNGSNYTAARRRFADGTLRPLWRSACAALETLVDVPAGSRLWFSSDDIPFLQEDVLDTAEINSKNATTIRSLVDGGFEPQSVVDAIAADDLSLLVHTGNVSVQLRPVDETGTPTMTPQQALED